MEMIFPITYKVNIYFITFGIAYFPKRFSTACKNFILFPPSSTYTNLCRLFPLTKTPLTSIAYNPIYYTVFKRYCQSVKPRNKMVRVQASHS